MTSEPEWDTGGLLTAGRFARATMLSAKALRLYADRGLLPPRLVDPTNGYRYYGDDQVRTGWLIALLRSAELSLDEIAGIVGASAADGLALLERAADGARRRAESNQAVLARARLHLRGEPSMPEPTTRIEGDRPVLSVLRRMRPDEMGASAVAGAIAVMGKEIKATVERRGANRPHDHLSGHSHTDRNQRGGCQAANRPSRFGHRARHGRRKPAMAEGVVSGSLGRSYLLTLGRQERR